MSNINNKISPFDGLLAAFVLLTRLPFWRIKSLPRAAFERVTDHWSLVGWLTGGISALSLYVFYVLLHLPLSVAVILCLSLRVFITGALHEDGLADIFDAMGAGGDRDRLLRIMKDSNSGAYALIGMIIYVALGIAILLSLPFEILLPAMAVGDPLAKGIASQLVNTLPYARPLLEAKVGVVYKRMNPFVFFFSLLFAVLPFAMILPWPYHLAGVAPVLCFVYLCLLFNRRIGGYTGDCCGATFLLCELSFWFGVLLVHTILIR